MTELRFYGAVLVALVMLLIFINTMTVHREARILAAHRNQIAIQSKMAGGGRNSAAMEPSSSAQGERRRKLHDRRLRLEQQQRQQQDSFSSPSGSVESDGDDEDSVIRSVMAKRRMMMMQSGSLDNNNNNSLTSSPTPPSAPQGLWSWLMSFVRSSETITPAPSGNNVSGTDEPQWPHPNDGLVMSRRQHFILESDGIIKNDNNLFDSVGKQNNAAVDGAGSTAAAGGDTDYGDTANFNNNRNNNYNSAPARDDDVGGGDGGGKVRQELQDVKGQLDKLQEMLLLQQEYRKLDKKKHRGGAGGGGGDGEGNNINIHIDVGEGGRRHSGDDDEDRNDDENEDGGNHRRHDHRHHRRRRVPCHRNRPGRKHFTKADLADDAGDGSTDREDVEAMQRANNELDGCDEQNEGGTLVELDDENCAGYPPEDGVPFQPYAKKLASGTIYEPRLAYVTYISSSEFALPAAVLMFSIANTGSQYARAICVTKEVSQSDRSWLSLFAQIIEIEKIPSPLRVDNERYRDVFTKLRMWELIMFDKVLYIDTDVIIRKNIDVLFDLSEWSVPIDAEEGRYSTGMMVLQPSLDTFRAMLFDLKTTQVSMELPDLLFLKEFFERRGSPSGIKMDDVPDEDGKVPTPAPPALTADEYSPGIQQQWKWENGRWIYNAPAVQPRSTFQYSWKPTPAAAAPPGARGIINIIPRWFQVYHIEFGSLYHSYLTHRVQKLTIHDPRIYGLHFPGAGKPWQDMDKKLRKFARFMCDPFSPEAKLKWRYQPQFVWYVLFGQMKRELRRLDRALIGAPIFESERGAMVSLRAYVEQYKQRQKQKSAWYHGGGYNNNYYNNKNINNDDDATMAPYQYGAKAIDEGDTNGYKKVPNDFTNGGSNMGNNHDGGAVFFTASSCVFWNDSGVVVSGKSSSSATGAILYDASATTTVADADAFPTTTTTTTTTEQPDAWPYTTTAAPSSSRLSYRQQFYKQQKSAYHYNNHNNNNNQNSGSAASDAPAPAAASTPAPSEPEQPAEPEQPQNIDSWTFSGSRRPLFDLTTLDPLLLALPQRTVVTAPVASSSNNSSKTISSLMQKQKNQWEQKETYTWVLSWCTRTMLRAGGDESCGEKAFVSQYSRSICRANFFQHFNMYRFGSVPRIVTQAEMDEQTAQREKEAAAEAKKKRKRKEELEKLKKRQRPDKKNKRNVAATTTTTTTNASDVREPVEEEEENNNKTAMTTTTTVMRSSSNNNNNSLLLLLVFHNSSANATENIRSSSNSSSVAGANKKTDEEENQFDAEYSVGDGVVLRSAVHLTSPTRTKWIDVVVRCDWSMENETDADFDFEHPAFSSAYTAVLLDTVHPPEKKDKHAQPPHDQSGSGSAAETTTTAVAAVGSAIGASSGSGSDKDEKEAADQYAAAAAAGYAALSAEKRYRIYVKSRCACPGGCGIARLWNETFLENGTLRQSVRDAWARNVTGVDAQAAKEEQKRQQALKHTTATTTTATTAAAVAGSDDGFATTTTTTGAAAGSSQLSSSQIGDATTTTTAAASIAPATSSPEEAQAAVVAASGAAWSRLESASSSVLQRCGLAGGGGLSKCGAVGYSRCMFVPKSEPEQQQLQQSTAVTAEANNTEASTTTTGAASSHSSPASAAGSSSSSAFGMSTAAAAKSKHPQAALHATWPHARFGQLDTNKTTATIASVHYTSSASGVLKKGSDVDSARGSCLPRYNASWILVSPKSRKRVCNCTHLGGDGEQRVTLQQCIRRADRSGANVINFAGDLPEQYEWLMELWRLGGVVPTTTTTTMTSAANDSFETTTAGSNRGKKRKLMMNNSSSTVKSVVDSLSVDDNNHDETTLSPGERAKQRARAARDKKKRQRQGQQLTTAAVVTTVNSESSDTAAAADETDATTAAAAARARAGAEARKRALKKGSSFFSSQQKQGDSDEMMQHLASLKGQRFGEKGKGVEKSAADDDKPGRRPASSYGTVSNKNRRKLPDFKKPVFGCYFKLCSTEQVLREEVPMSAEKSGEYSVFVRNSFHLDDA